MLLLTSNEQHFLALSVLLTSPRLLFRASKLPLNLLRALKPNLTRDDDDDFDSNPLYLHLSEDPQHANDWNVASLASFR